ncbi:uncharacterized protein LOC139911217 [Centroberyx gerrardi]|uniref:uncharacterized protein n=1 Tax=Centroberyx gerrardi TaxID=166262 RepID=UPI003AB0BD73
MKSHWIVMILVVSITMPGLWMLLVTGTEVQQVQFGSTVTLGCDFSYLHETTWLKHNPELIPTMILCTSLRDGQPVKEFQLSSRFSVELMNRSLALKISNVEERDLGLYYCIAKEKQRMKVGRGTRLQATGWKPPVVPSGSPPGPSWLFFYQWYCVVVGFGLLTMVLAVCITHWKTNKAAKKGRKTQLLLASAPTRPPPVTAPERTKPPPTIRKLTKPPAAATKLNVHSHCEQLG